MTDKYLIIPIETKAREYQAKLLLSCMAAQSGFVCLLGSKWEIQRNIQYLPRGIYMDWSLATGQEEPTRKIYSYGNHGVAWCEEGLVFDPAAYLKNRVSLKTYQQIDRFFAWGNNQKKVISDKVGGASNKIALTGNPRFDLLTFPYREVFRDEVNRIQSRFSRTIQVNTSFAMYNNFFEPDDFFAQTKAKGLIATKEDEQRFWRHHTYHQSMFQQFRELIYFLSQTLPEHNIIVRPHPSENHNRWREELQGLSNVHVIYEGTVVPWMMAADAVIHHNCTTGVEAFFLEKPVFSYGLNKPDDFYEPLLPDLISVKINSPEEAQTALQKLFVDPQAFVKRQQNDPETLALLKQHVANVRGNLASERIVQELSLIANEIFPLTDLRPVSKISYWLFKLRYYKNSIREAAKKIVSSRKTYRQQKFPGLDVTEINRDIQILQTITAGKLTDMRVEKVNGFHNVFSIRRVNKV